METIEASLISLSLNVPVPKIDGTDILSNPLSIYRAYLAKILAEIAYCDTETANKAIQWPNNIDNGDLTVTLPKLRSGAKANDAFGVELIQKARQELPPDTSQH